MAVSRLPAAEPEDVGPKASRGQLWRPLRGCGQEGSFPTAAPRAIKIRFLRAHAPQLPCHSSLSPYNTQEAQRACKEEVVLYLNNKTPTTFYLCLNYDPSLLSQ